jgi:hypothetical protein
MPYRLAIPAVRAQLGTLAANSILNSAVWLKCRCTFERNGNSNKEVCTLKSLKPKAMKRRHLALEAYPTLALEPTLLIAVFVENIRTDGTVIFKSQNRIELCRKRDRRLTRGVGMRSSDSK